MVWIIILVILIILMSFSSIKRNKKNKRTLEDKTEDPKSEVNNYQHINTYLSNSNNNEKKQNTEDNIYFQENIYNQSAKQNELPVNFNEDVFKDIFELMEKTYNSIFITGKAGTGKSTLIDYYKTKTKKNTVYLAPTGVAALNIRGKTIHAFFKFPPEVITSDVIERINYKERDIDLYKIVETIIIDEISMVRADLIQGIDYVLKKHRKNYKPFGGVQMIFIGDMYQLPPVVGKEKVKITYKGKELFNRELRIIDYFQIKYKGPYFFNSDAFKNAFFLFYELDTIFRQNDNNFINILNSIRENKINENILDILNKQINTVENNEENRIMLCTRKNTVKYRNKKMLKNLNTTPITYYADIKGSFEHIKPEDYPTEKELILKKNAQVMMLVNDKNGKWVNGTIGKIKNLSNENIEVEINSICYIINKNTWETVDYVYDRDLDILKANKTGEFTQYPLMLAWAITIHKSQGKTFEKVTIDLDNGAFTHGQTYVALSRCKTLEGIVLKRPVKRKDIIVDNEVTAFINKMNMNNINENNILF